MEYDDRRPNRSPPALFHDRTAPESRTESPTPAANVINIKPDHGSAAEALLDDSDITVVPAVHRSSDSEQEYEQNT